MKTFFFLTLVSVSAWAQIPPSAHEVLKALLPAGDYLGRSIDGEDCTVDFYRTATETRVEMDSSMRSDFMLKADAAYTWTSRLPPTFRSSYVVSDDGREKVEQALVVTQRTGGRWTVTIQRILTVEERRWVSGQDCHLD